MSDYNGSSARMPHFMDCVKTGSWLSTNVPCNSATLYCPFTFPTTTGSGTIVLFPGSVSSGGFVGFIVEYDSDKNPVNYLKLYFNVNNDANGCLARLVMFLVSVISSTVSATLASISGTFNAVITRNMSSKIIGSSVLQDFTGLLTVATPNDQISAVPASTGVSARFINLDPTFRQIGSENGSAQPPPNTQRSSFYAPADALNTYFSGADPLALSIIDEAAPYSTFTSGEIPFVTISDFVITPTCFFSAVTFTAQPGVDYYFEYMASLKVYNKNGDILKNTYQQLGSQWLHGTALSPGPVFLPSRSCSAIFNVTQLEFPETVPGNPNSRYDATSYVVIEYWIQCPLQTSALATVPYTGLVNVNMLDFMGNVKKIGMDTMLIGFAGFSAGQQVTVSIVSQAQFVVESPLCATFEPNTYQLRDLVHEAFERVLNNPMHYGWNQLTVPSELRNNTEILQAALEIASHELAEDWETFLPAACEMVCCLSQDDPVLSNNRSRMDPSNVSNNATMSIRSLSQRIAKAWKKVPKPIQQLSANILNAGVKNLKNIGSQELSEVFKLVKESANDGSLFYDPVGSVERIAVNTVKDAGRRLISPQNVKQFANDVRRPTKAKMATGGSCEGMAYYPPNFGLVSPNDPGSRRRQQMATKDPFIATKTRSRHFDRRKDLAPKDYYPTDSQWFGIDQGFEDSFDFDEQPSQPKKRQNRQRMSTGRVINSQINVQSGSRIWDYNQTGMLTNPPLCVPPPKYEFEDIHTNKQTMMTKRPQFTQPISQPFYKVPKVAANLVPGVDMTEVARKFSCEGDLKKALETENVVVGDLWAVFIAPEDFKTSGRPSSTILGGHKFYGWKPSTPERAERFNVKVTKDIAIAMIVKEDDDHWYVDLSSQADGRSCELAVFVMKYGQYFSNIIFSGSITNGHIDVLPLSTGLLKDVVAKENGKKIVANFSGADYRVYTTEELLSILKPKKQVMMQRAIVFDGAKTDSSQSGLSANQAAQGIDFFATNGNMDLSSVDSVINSAISKTPVELTARVVMAPQMDSPLIQKRCLATLINSLGLTDQVDYSNIEDKMGPVESELDKYFEDIYTHNKLPINTPLVATFDRPHQSLITPGDDYVKWLCLSKMLKIVPGLHQFIYAPFMDKTRTSVVLNFLAQSLCHCWNLSAFKAGFKSCKLPEKSVPLGFPVVDDASTFPIMILLGKIKYHAMISEGQIYLCDFAHIRVLSTGMSEGVFLSKLTLDKLANPFICILPDPFDLMMFNPATEKNLTMTIRTLQGARPIVSKTIRSSSQSMSMKDPFANNPQNNLILGQDGRIWQAIELFDKYNIPNTAIVKESQDRRASMMNNSLWNLKKQAINVSRGKPTTIPMTKEVATSILDSIKTIQAAQKPVDPKKPTPKKWDALTADEIIKPLLAQAAALSVARPKPKKLAVEVEKLAADDVWMQVIKGHPIGKLSPKLAKVVAYFPALPSLVRKDPVMMETLADSAISAGAGKIGDIAKFALDVYFAILEKYGQEKVPTLPATTKTLESINDVPEILDQIGQEENPARNIGELAGEEH